jgi:hypothetical protein
MQFLRDAGALGKAFLKAQLHFLTPLAEAQAPSQGEEGGGAADGAEAEP